MTDMSLGKWADQPGAVAPFDRIAPEQVVPLVKAAIDAHYKAIEQICFSHERSFETVLLAKESADLRLSHLWSPISHLHGVRNTPALREAHAAAEKMLSDHGLWVSQNRALYEVIADLDDSGWDAAKRRVRDLALRDFALSGVALGGEARSRYREIVTELTRLTTEFGNAVLDATDAFHLDIPRKGMLAGIPVADVDRFRAAAVAAGVPGWRISLQAPDVHAVLTHAWSRTLRRRIYRAKATLASDQGPHAGQFDNSGRIEKIVALRHEAARLLGFPTIADQSLATKMASSPDAVETFLVDLGRQAKVMAERDKALVDEVASDTFGIDKVQPWDIAFVSEAIRNRRYAFDAEAVRAWFPAERVIHGTCALLTRLFGIAFDRRDDVPLWHPDAGYYDVLDRDGKVIAGIYIDLFARAGKKGGAWMSDCRLRYPAPEGLHMPVAFLTCNFAGCGDDRVATLRHDEVVTFLHEFGHVLHHILTEVDYPSIGGINGVEWDAVELPSQLLENFAWDYPALVLLSSHIDTGEPLPEELFDKMLAARNFQSGLRLCRQLEFALFDLRLHRDFDPARDVRALPLLAKVRSELAVVDVPRWNRFPHAFTHIFSGGYSAGYYGYLWAELLSADAFGRFRDAGGICPDVGTAFKREILARGATRPAADSFIAFRGREPESDALLASYGLAA